MNICLSSINEIDRNLDNRITISDIWGTIKAYTNLPVEIIIDLLEETEVYHFFELSKTSCTSNQTFMLSILIWGVIFYVLILWFEDKSKEEYAEKKKKMGY
jgi:hypothetical protein